ncbi:hypothetical protein [Streptomyces sp. NPDC001070]
MATVIVVILLAMLVATRVRGLVTAARVRRSSSPARTGSGPLLREEVEKLLVAGRTTGVLSWQEYQDAMARLAAFEDTCCPLWVPQLRDD